MTDSVVKVYVPTKEIFWVLPGSAIVAIDGTLEDGIYAYFEGDKYGRGMDYEEKVLVAASRCLENYPTVARAYFDRESLLEVGEYDYVARRLTLDLPNEVDAWNRAGFPE